MTTPPPRDHVFVGVSVGDTIRHVEARLGFLEGFVTDEQVRALYRDWAKLDDIGRKVSLVAASYENEARLLGLPGRAALFNAADIGELSFPADVVETGAFQNVMARLIRRSDDLWAAWDSLIETDVLIDSALEFTRRFKLPWIWLATFIIDGFMGTFRAHIEDAELMTVLQVEPIEQPTPDDLGLSFTRNPGESAAATLRRFRSESAGFEERLAAIASTGPIPRKTRETFRIYGRWLYETTLGGQSNRSIARREFGGANPSDQASRVRYGLRRARELLALGDRVVSDSEAGDKPRS